jgi:hypothetical protein
MEMEFTPPEAKGPDLYCKYKIQIKLKIVNKHYSK